MSADKPLQLSNLVKWATVNCQYPYVNRVTQEDGKSCSSNAFDVTTTSTATHELHDSVSP
jgi:hypothetical protein